MSIFADFSAAQSVAVQLETRPLIGDDSPAYRILRQNIRNSADGRYFSDSYEREAKLTTDALWRDWCTEKREHCIMGIFADKKLVGFMMITQQGDITSPVVEWEATWLDPRFRGSKLAKAGYEKVFDWTVQQGFKFAAVFIRSDNARSQKIRKGQGFADAYTIKNQIWADGSKGDTNAYVMALDEPTPELRHLKALRSLGEVIVHLHAGPHAPQVYQDAETPVSMPTHLSAKTGRGLG